MTDGNLKFDTKIDTDGFSKGVNTLKSNFNNLKSTIKGTGKAVDDAFSGTASSKAVDLNGKIEQTESQIKSLRAEMEKMTNTPFVSKEADSLKSQVDKAEQQMLSLLNQREQLEEGLKGGIADLGLPAHSPEAIQGLYEANAEWQKLTDKITQADGKLTQYEGKLQDVRQADARALTTGTEEYTKKEQKLQELMNKLDVYKAKLNEVKQAEEKKALSANQASKSTDRLAGSMKGTTKTAVPLTKSILKLSSMFKLMLMRMAIRATIDAVKEGFENLAQVSPELNGNLSLLKSSLTQLKNSLATAFAPILNIVTPILNSFIQMLVRAANAVAQFFAILGGKSSYKKAVEVQQDYAKSLKDTGSQAKKTAKDVKKSLTSIDDVNILGDGSSGTGAGGGGGMGELTPDQMFDEVAVSAKFAEMIDSFKKKIGEIADVIKESFTEGFESGLGEVNFDKIKEHALGIKESLKGIFTDPDVKSAMTTWLTNVSYAMGEFVGSFSSIGLTIAELVLGSIDKYLEQNADFIKEKLIAIFDIRGETALIISNFTAVLADIFTVFRGDDSKQIGADLIAIFTNSFLSILELGSMFGRDLMSAIATPITDNQELIKDTLYNMLGIISEVIGGIKDFLANTFESVKSSYDEYMAPALESFSNGFSQVFESVLEAYNEYFAPVLEVLAEKLGELINGPVADTVQSFTDLVGKIVDGVAEIWEETLAPFISWLIEILSPVVSGALEGAGNAFFGVLEVVLDVVGSLLDSLGGLIDFITGLFTGDWEKAWDGIKTFFSGIIDAILEIVSPIADFFKEKFGNAWANVKDAFSAGKVRTFFNNAITTIKDIFANIPKWFKDKFTEAWTNVKNVFSTGGKIFDGIKDGIASTFKTIVNGLISGINRIIAAPFNAINSMLNKIRSISILGAKPFRSMWSRSPVSVPRIPKLATGTVVPANYGEFAAILGDNKRETEVVSPLSTMKQAMKEALKESSSSNGGTTILKVYLEGKQVYQEVVKQNNQNTRRTGVNALVDA